MEWVAVVCLLIIQFPTDLPTTLFVYSENVQYIPKKLPFGKVYPNEVQRTLTVVMWATLAEQSVSHLKSLRAKILYK